ncbi:MAG: TlpA family protein disulfide reductase [Puniceicoccales bacterium]|nr:TlpA family protein disulfide reductase [Puniceicoccales bacterium]
MKKLSSLLLAALLTLLALPPSATAAAKEPAIGDTAPDFSFTDFDGKKHHLSEFRGKPVLLDVWATWCGPCIQEIPTLRALHEELDKNFIILSISIDDKPGTAQAYVAKNNMPWTQGFCPGA